MRMHRTKCPKCGLQWDNKDERDYSQDRCPNCKIPVEHSIIDVKQQINGLPAFCIVPDKSIE